MTASERTAVLLEEIRAQNNVLLESVTAHRESTDRALGHMAESIRVLGADLALLASSTTERFSESNARFDAVDARFDAVDARFDAVDARFDVVDRKADAAALAALDQRVTLLERRTRI
jgi:pimeloyl-CoA synthetase